MDTGLPHFTAGTVRLKGEVKRPLGQEGLGHYQFMEELLLKVSNSYNNCG